MSNVVDIGDFRINRQDSRFKIGQCKHRNLTLDENGHTVHCDDCNTHLSAYYVLHMIIGEYGRALDNLNHEKQHMAREKQKNLHFTVAKDLETIWRGPMVPCCPHCGVGILMTDGIGSQRINKEFEIKRREKQKS
jgi:hypothetical protein